MTDVSQLAELIDFIIKVFGALFAIGSLGVTIFLWRMGSLFVSAKTYKEDMTALKAEIKEHATQIAQQETNVKIVSNKIDALEKNIEVIIKTSSELTRKDLNNFSEIFKKDFEGVKADIQHMNGNLKQYSQNQTNIMDRITHLESNERK